jgi:hypothetical protein
MAIISTQTPPPSVTPSFSLTHILRERGGKEERKRKREGEKEGGKERKREGEGDREKERRREVA